MLRLRGGRFAAFLTDLGGPTSHTAIVARSMNVPAVVGLGHFRALVRDGDTLVADGFSGTVVVKPPDSVLREFRDRQDDDDRERAEIAVRRTSTVVKSCGIR